MLEKIYAESHIEIEDENTKKFLLKMCEMEKMAKEKYGEDSYRYYTIGQHDILREVLKLPNKLFTIGTTKDESLVVIILFPVKANGELYSAKIDEETGVPYLLMESK